MSGRSTGRGIGFTVGAVVVGAVVAAVALFIAGRSAAPDVLAGVGSAVVLQVALYWVLFEWTLASRPTLAYGLAAGVRLAVVALMAFVGAPALGLSPAPTLLSMVACLFGSTLLEALFLQRRGEARVGPGVATMR